MNNENSNNTLKIDIDASEIILTPSICASLVNEILRCIIYQKSQIPYPYSRLKAVVNKKRNSLNNEEEKKLVNFKLNNHFRTVSSFYDNMEHIMENINEEFSNKNNLIKDVVIVFGVTPFCPSEIFTIKINKLALGHLEKNHHRDAAKHQQKILRHIFLSQSWIDSIDASLSCTNTFVFLRKGVLQSKKSNQTENCFLPTKPPNFFGKIKQTIISFNSKDVHYSCCDHLTVFEDTDNILLRKINENNDFVDVWCQSKVLLQGFKDIYIDKVSASDLW